MTNRRESRDEKVRFDEPSGELSVTLSQLALLRHRQRTEIARGESVHGSAVVVGESLEIAGEVSGHVVAVGCDVYLRSGGRIAGYLYLVDSRLHCDVPWDRDHRFHSTLLPRPWTEVVISAEDRTGNGSQRPRRGGLRTWRLQAVQAPPPATAGDRPTVSIDTRTGMTQVMKGGEGSLRFVVDGVDRTSMFAPFAKDTLSFSCGPVLAFGGTGATLSRRTQEWAIPSGQVVVVSADGLVVMGATDGVRYQPAQERLIGSRAIVKLDLEERKETFEGSEVIYRIPDRSVEVRP